MSEDGQLQSSWYLDSGATSGWLGSGILRKNRDHSTCLRVEPVGRWDDYSAEPASELFGLRHWTAGWITRQGGNARPNDN